MDGRDEPGHDLERLVPRSSDEPLADDKAMINREALRDGVVKLSLGRKKHVLLKAVE